MNIIPKFQRIRTIQPGTYSAVCVSVEDRPMRIWQSEETEPGIRFTYEVRAPEETVLLSRDCRKILSARSKLVKDLRAIHGLQKITDNFLHTSSDEVIAKVIKACVGKMVITTVDLSETGYNNIKEITSIPQQPTAQTRAPTDTHTKTPKTAPKPAASIDSIMDLSDPDVDVDDEIPF